MPYNNYYQNYPFMQMPYMQNYQQSLQQAQQPIQQPAQIQDGGVVCVKDETAARNYPIAPGVSMTLIDEPRQHFMSITGRCIGRQLLKHKRLIYGKDHYRRAQYS